MVAKILIVYDDPVVLQVVAAILRREKYDVLTAVTATEARQQTTLYKGEIDLLIVNHTLANRQGRDLVEELLLLRPQMKVLRFSGHLESDLRARGEMGPQSFFIQKPFSPKQFAAKVRDIVGPAL